MTFLDVLKSVPGLTNYYPLATDANDVVGTQHGVASGVTYSGGKAVFNGSASINLGDSNNFSVTSTGALTILVFATFDNWVGAGADEYVHWMGKGQLGAQEWTFRHYIQGSLVGDAPDRPGRASFYHFNPGGGIGAGSYYQDPTFPTNERVFVATCNTTQLSLATDGVIRDTDLLTSVSPAIVPQNTTSPVYLGTRGDNSGFLVGKLRRVAFYNRVLTASEITTIYNARAQADGGISHVAISGPAAATTGALGIDWVTPTVNNTVVLHIAALAGQAMPTAITGWTPLQPATTAAGWVTASFWRVTDGTETGTLSVLTATTPCIAWIREWHGMTVPPTPTWAHGSDANDGADGITTLAAAGVTTVAGDVVSTNTVWASSTPSFPTAPVAATARAITQSGATLSAITNRAGATWLTNHRYNISDVTVTAGAATAPQYVSNTTAANLRGVTSFTVLDEVTTVPVTIAVPTVVNNITTTIPTILSVVDLTAPTPVDPVTPVGPTVSGGALAVVPTVLNPVTPIAPTVIANTTTVVGKSLTFLYNVTGTPLVQVDLTLSWNVDAAIVDSDHPPVNPGESSSPAQLPANEGLEYELQQPIALDMLQESLETPTMIFHTTPDTIPSSGDVTLDTHSDEPLTQPGVEKVWTETQSSMPAELSSGPPEPSTTETS